MDARRGYECCAWRRRRLGEKEGLGKHGGFRDRRRTFGDHADVDGVVVGPERDEHAAGAPRDEQGLGEIVRDLGLPGLDHARGDAEVVVGEFEEEVVAQVGDLPSRRGDVLALLGRHEEALKPGRKRGRRGVVAVELQGNAVVEVVAHVVGLLLFRGEGSDRVKGEFAFGFGANRRMSAGAVASGAVVERVGGRNGASAYRERSDGGPSALDSVPRALVTFREKSRVSCHVTPDLAPDFYKVLCAVPSEKKPRLEGVVAPQLARRGGIGGGSRAAKHVRRSISDQRTEIRGGDRVARAEEGCDGAHRRRRDRAGQRNHH